VVCLINTSQKELLTTIVAFVNEEEGVNTFWGLEGWLRGPKKTHWQAACVTLVSCQ
jgi:hypothetical protein